MKKKKEESEEYDASNDLSDVVCSCGIVFKGTLGLYQRVLDLINSEGTSIYQRTAPSFEKLWIYNKEDEEMTQR